ncbi:MAG: hypothetical protein HZB43_01110 [candidate division Zixibacteria bacterium]|nr:hypothetical protein [candidate division Zixibacteria bacterium]
MPAGELVLGVYGLGRLDDTLKSPLYITTVTVGENGAFLGEWDLGPNFGPTEFLPGANSFVLRNLLPGNGVPGDPSFNSDLAVVRFPGTGAFWTLTLNVTHIGYDGISFTIGRAYPKNHYLTWRMDEPSWVDTHQVAVRDQFMTDVLDLDSIDFMSNPARKDTFNITSDTTDHLTWYRARGRDTLLYVTFRDQFESTSVCIDSVKYLLVPNQKLPHGPVHDLDHYKAYRIRRPPTLNRRVELQDQFATLPELVDTLKPTYFLTPAQKFSEPQTDTVTHYVAYEIVPKHPTSETRNTVDQFGSHVFTFRQSEFLLVPAIKLAATTHVSLGDINNDGIPLTIADFTALIRFVSFTGPPPIPLWEGDLNADGYIDYDDLMLFYCYMQSGLSCFPRYPIPVPCCTDTTRGCCMTSTGNYIRSPANCARAWGIYLGDGKDCPCLPVPKDLELWLTFDEETTGPSKNLAAAVDGIQQGSLVGTPGEVNGALRFDGVSSYVDVASYPGINPGAGDFTIDAWVTRGADDNQVRVIADKRSNVGGFFGYEFFLYNGRLGFQLGVGPYNNWMTSTSETVPVTGWHHVAVTVDRNVEGRFYLDGDPIGVPMGVSGWMGSCDNSSPFRVGAVSFSPGSYFLGGIDEVEMFRRALTPAEIKAIYDAQNIGKCRCYCPHQGDIVPDGVIDVFDVIGLIDIAFSGALDPQDPACPTTRGDLNGDGVTDIFDIIYLIDMAFAGGPDPVDPCISLH